MDSAYIYHKKEPLDIEKSEDSELSMISKKLTHIQQFWLYLKNTNFNYILIMKLLVTS